MMLIFCAFPKFHLALYALDFSNVLLVVDLKRQKTNTIERLRIAVLIEGKVGSFRCKLKPGFFGFNGNGMEEYC